MKKNYLKPLLRRSMLCIQHQENQEYIPNAFHDTIASTHNAMLMAGCLAGNKKVYKKLDDVESSLRRASGWLKRWK